MVGVKCGFEARYCWDCCGKKNAIESVIHHDLSEIFMYFVLLVGKNMLGASRSCRGSKYVRTCMVVCDILVVLAGLDYSNDDRWERLRPFPYYLL